MHKVCLANGRMSTLENSTRSGLFALWELLGHLAPNSVRERERRVGPGVLGCEGGFLISLTPDQITLSLPASFISFLQSEVSGSGCLTV